MISTLGPKLNTVFRSRWRAVWWCAGVLLTAYCSVPAPPDSADSASQAQDHQTVKAVAGFLGAPQQGGSGGHRNPWAKDPPPATPEAPH